MSTPPILPTASGEPADAIPAAVPSLRWRLLGATVVSLALALLGFHWWLGGLFRDHVLRQFDATLVQQLDQVTARLSLGTQGQAEVDSAALSDPRWSRPFSGLYWQLDRVDVAGQTPPFPHPPSQRSRSLWDTRLSLPDDTLANGELHTHALTGPRGESLRGVERALQIGDQITHRWRLTVAADDSETLAAVQRFNGLLGLSLLGLGGLLALAAWAQVQVGLAPLRAMRGALAQVLAGHTERLQGRFPAEVQPLVDRFNAVLDHQADSVARARTHAGNLAHALKTPLAAIANAAGQSPDLDTRALVQEQVAVARRHIDWHLARARAAATQGVPGQRSAVAPVVAGLVRVMGKVYAERALALQVAPIDGHWAFAGEAQDLQEMVGNLLDNACRCARSRVVVQVMVAPPESVPTPAPERAGQGRPLMVIAIEDDGPGIAPDKRADALQRGVRLDERPGQQGSGLGLAIVVDLARLYGGDLMLDSGALGGLRAQLTLPAAG